MTNLTVFNGGNSQEIALSGLVDAFGGAVSTATITATLTRSGTTLPNSTMSFTPDTTPGDYKATLDSFDATPGAALMEVTGSHDGSAFSFSVFVTVAKRSL